MPFRTKAVLVLAMAWCAASRAATNEIIAPKSTVVLVRDASAVKGFDADTQKARTMVSLGVRTLTGKGSDAEAWSALVNSNDVVGIKIYTQPAPLQRTHPAIVDAIADGLRAAGVAATNIVVWDRDAAKMAQAGYIADPKLNQRYRLAPVVPDGGWNRDVFYESRLVGKLIWGDLKFGSNETSVNLSTRSHFPKLLTDDITKLINCPVLQDNDGCGIAGCLYNLSLGAVDNTRRFESMGQHGDPAIAEIVSMPVIRRKLVLNIMDALVGGYAGGPAFKPNYSWRYGGIYFSRDPVAVDALCVELLEAKRREAKISPIGDEANHIKTAAKFGLGQCDRDQIEQIEPKS